MNKKYSFKTKEEEDAYFEKIENETHSITSDFILQHVTSQNRKKRLETIIHICKGISTLENKAKTNMLTVEEKYELETLHNKLSLILKAKEPAQHVE